MHARVDQHFSEKDDLKRRCFYDKSPQSTPDPYLLATHQALSKGGWWSEENTLSAVSSEYCPVVFNRTEGFVGKAGVALNPLAGGSQSRHARGPNRRHRSFMGQGLSADLQPSETSHFHQVQNSYQFYDDVFLTRGNHALKFGFAASGYKTTHWPSQAKRDFNFKGLDRSLQISPSVSRSEIRYPGVIQPDSPPRGYVQDNWRFPPQLTQTLACVMR